MFFVVIKIKMCDNVNNLRLEPVLNENKEPVYTEVDGQLFLETDG